MGNKAPAKEAGDRLRVRNAVLLDSTAKLRKRSQLGVFMFMQTDTFRPNDGSKDFSVIRYFVYDIRESGTQKSILTFKEANDDFLRRESELQQPKLKKNDTRSEHGSKTDREIRMAAGPSRS